MFNGNKIVDTFLFFNELDVLKIRLEELYPVVDEFVLIESNKTFRGIDKPYYFDENKHLFEKYLDKISAVKIIDPGKFNDDYRLDPWEREVWTRNQTHNHLYLAKDDILIFGDVDEIPRRSIIEKLRPDPLVAIQTDVFVYRLNLFDAKGASLKAVRNSYGINLKNLEKLRRLPPDVYIENGGWHFSSLGDAQHISEKFKAFSHWELGDNDHLTDPAKIQQRIENLVEPMERATLTKVEVDDTWPEAIKNDREYWVKWIV